MTSAQIFISYRRDDSAGYARAIGDALAQRFGPERVFIDVDDIGAGQSFDRAIDEAVAGSRVLLVLIGRRWLATAEGAPRRRLDDPDDLVRHEVASGLAKGLQVIPLRVDRGLLEGRIDADGSLQFSTRTQEQLGADGPLRELTHRYRGRLAGDELRLVLQTEGGSSPHRPVEFTARRAAR